MITPTPATGPSSTTEPSPRRPALLARVLALPMIGVVKLYQLTLSPVTGRQCRFHPTCSWYALEALRLHGGVRGGWLTLRRLARCHPFTKLDTPYDPVPPPPPPVADQNPR
jgi:uncharacterized protein